VTLFNLSPGDHLLEVQSTDRYGRWADNVKGISIEVAPYWHETWWARILALIGVCAFVYAVVYVWLYVRRLDRQRRELLEKYTALIAAREVSPSEPEGTPVENESEPVALTEGQRPEDATFLNRVRLYISENIGNPEANIDDMAASAAVSRSTLNRRLKSCLGVSAAQLMIEARMKRACQLLTDGSARSMGEVADMCGYADVQYFQRAFRKRFGVAPADYGREV
ncbi:MAG: AraC family transcriptional regulator, partial [Duncaniella sp.]|nr:AraC family transcriptional regulator [Duncaniella sp.]